VANALVTRLKIMCNLDIAERRLPQDGRIVFKKFTKKNIDIDLRVATGPMNFGEKVVMRILDKQKSTLPLPALGFSEENLAKYRECIRQPYGMILHCGPTGSGKSMTLYSALAEVNTPDVNIQTAEDPIEYTLAGINQMQMSRQIGLTFARALRCYLRMDPDMILVGEIRDEETAGIAVEAALTGHLLVSTLHTNDAPSTVARLSEMGIEPFNISASLVCVCAQRLLRRVCKNCKQPYEPKGREKEIIEKALGWSGQIFKANPQGCPVCNGNGYKGRVGIHELMMKQRGAHRGHQQGGRGRPAQAHRDEDGDEDAPPGLDAQGEDGPHHDGGGPGQRPAGSDPVAADGNPSIEVLGFEVWVLGSDPDTPYLRPTAVKILVRGSDGPLSCKFA
jgi:type II secretory ATPase GspE/PulE/Tfp pilus assembly ATPase PilB-like protein